MGSQNSMAEPQGKRVYVLTSCGPLFFGRIPEGCLDNETTHLENISAIDPWDEQSKTLSDLAYGDLPPDSDKRHRHFINEIYLMRSQIVGFISFRWSRGKVPTRMIDD